jgi:protein-disulfide isomerase
MPAAMASEAAGEQGKFWEMHDKMFENQRQLSDANYEKWAQELGLNMTKFKADLKSPKLTKRIKAQQAKAVSLGARGTPAFFINGRFLSGAQPFPKFKEVIDAELKKADAAIAKGTAQKDYYKKFVVDKGSKKI